MSQAFKGLLHLLTNATQPAKPEVPVYREAPDRVIAYLHPLIPNRSVPSMYREVEGDHHDFFGIQDIGYQLSLLEDWSFPDPNRPRVFALWLRRYRPGTEFFVFGFAQTDSDQFLAIASPSTSENAAKLRDIWELVRAGNIFNGSAQTDFS